MKKMSWTSLLKFQNWSVLWCQLSNFCQNVVYVKPILKTKALGMLRDCYVKSRLIQETVHFRTVYFYTFLEYNRYTRRSNWMRLSASFKEVYELILFFWESMDWSSLLWGSPFIVQIVLVNSMTDMLVLWTSMDWYSWLGKSMDRSAALRKSTERLSRSTGLRIEILNNGKKVSLKFSDLRTFVMTLLPLLPPSVQICPHLTYLWNAERGGTNRTFSSEIVGTENTPLLT